MTTHFFSTHTGPTEAPAPMPAGPFIREDAGTSSVVLNGNTANASHTGKDRYSTADLPADQFGAGTWQSTARTPTGSPARQITSDTVVTLAGVQGRVKDFVSAGVLHEQGPGQYSEAPQEFQTQAPQAAHVDAAVMPEEIVQAVDQALEPLSDSAIQVGIAHATLAAVGDGNLQAVVEAVARSSGMEPSEALSRAEFVVQAYQSQTGHYLGKLGIMAEDLPAFYEDMKLHHKAGLKDAINRQLNANDLAGWRNLAAKWMATTAPGPQALARAGLDVRGDEVRVNGGWMPIRSAAKAGLI